MNIKALVKVRWLTLLITGLLVVALALGGCVQQDPGRQQDPPPPPPRRLVVGGSTTVAVLNELLAERFMALHNRTVVVETHSVGSTAGIEGVNDGRWHIGMSSRALRGAELGWNLTQFTICYDAVAVIVHPTNPVGNLTRRQLAEIFTGNITNWADVGGPDLNITVIIREAGSGARASFEDLVHRGIPPAPDLILIHTLGVRAGVAFLPAAIGYVTLIAVDASVKAVKVDGVEPTAEAVKAGRYPLFYRYLLLTKGAPDPLEREFIDWVLGPEGQQMIHDEGMVRVR